MDTSTADGLAVKELLTPAEVEQVYGLNPRTLRQWRYEGHGPRYVKTMPGRSGLVMYRRTDIDAWLLERTVQPAAALMTPGHVLRGGRDRDRARPQRAPGRAHHSLGAA